MSFLVDIMAPKRVTRSTSRGGATARGGRTGGRGGRGDAHNTSNGGRTGGRGGRGDAHDTSNPGNNGGNLDVSAIIAQQLQNLLPTIVTQIGDHMNN
jgi:hypothetical protein